jgi:hypothetical protein
VHVGGVLGQLPLVLARDGEVVVRLGAGGDVDVAEARASSMAFFDQIPVSM